jgi:hypothetical protein
MVFWPSNAADNAKSTVNGPVPFEERRLMFRFSIGRTFGGSR